MTQPRALFALLAASIAAPHAAADVGLVVLPRPSGFVGATAYDISADGTTVVGSISRGTAPIPDTHHAVRWVLGQEPQDLGFIPNAMNTRALSVSSDGRVLIGRAENGINPIYFRWEAAGPLVPLPVPAQTNFIAASAVSPDGSFTVGTRSSPTGTNAVRWDGFAAPQPLSSPPGAIATGATCIAPTGEIIGTALIGSATCLTRWTGDTPEVLDPVPNHLAFATFAASAGGQTLVGAITPTGSGSFYDQPFRWTADEGFEMLSRPAGTVGAAVYDISLDGAIAVGTSFTDSINDPWIATAWVGDEVMTLSNYLSSAGIDVTGWHFMEARGISPDGTVIVGSAITPAGVREAFIATVPSPGGAAALVIGAGLGLRRRRR